MSIDAATGIEPAVRKAFVAGQDREAQARLCGQGPGADRKDPATEAKAEQAGERTDSGGQSAAFSQEAGSKRAGLGIEITTVNIQIPTSNPQGSSTFWKEQSGFY